MRRALVLVSVLALLVAACGGDAAEETTTTTVADDDTTTTGAEETTTTSAETTTSQAETSGGGGDECLLGDWSLDTEAFFDALADAFADEAGAAGEMSAGGGTAITTFNADGTITDVRDDWGFVVETADGTVNMTMNGEQSGTWSTDGSTLFVTLEQTEPFDVEVTVESGGQTFTLPNSPVDVPTESMSAEGEYQCDGDTLTVETDEITSTFTRP